MPSFLDPPRRLFIPLLLAIILSACGKPVPPEKSDYVGDWVAPDMALSIDQDGTVKFAHKVKGVSRALKGSLRSFEGNDFTIRIGPVPTTFNVGAAPHRDGDSWKMTVYGTELTKKQ